MWTEFTSIGGYTELYFHWSYPTVPISPTTHQCSTLVHGPDTCKFGRFFLKSWFLKKNLMIYLFLPLCLSAFCCCEKFLRKLTCKEGRFILACGLEVSVYDGMASLLLVWVKIMVQDADHSWQLWRKETRISVSPFEDTFLVIQFSFAMSSFLKVLSPPSSAAG